MAYEQIATRSWVEGKSYSTVNPNLLDNWYFGNPVNQRNVSGTISAAGYFFDRWKLTSGSVTINSDSITLNGTVVQILEKAVGQTVKATALTANGIDEVTPVYNDSEKTLTVTAANKTIKAVKLELGSVQTLAHQENGIWVLNETPHYGEQLIRCQRFFYKTAAMSEWYRADFITANAIYTIIPIPAPMRATPSIVDSSSITVQPLSSASPVDGFTHTLSGGKDGSLRIASTKTAHGLTDAAIQAVSLALSADL